MAASYLQSILASASTVDCLSNTRLAICETLRRLVRPDEEVCVDAAATGRNHGGPSVEFTESDGGLAVTLTSASRGFAFARFRVAVTTPLPATSRAALAQELELYAAVSGLVLRAMQLEADVSSAKASGEALVDASRLARIAPGLSVDELLTRMAAIVHRCISTEYVSIYLVNEASRSLFCMFSDTKTVSEHDVSSQSHSLAPLAARQPTPLS